MRNFNPFAVRPQAVLHAPADGAASGGADAAGADAGETGEAGDDAVDGDGDAGDAGDSEGHSDPQTDEDDESLLFGSDEDDQDDARSIEERHKRLSQAHNKLKRRFGKNLGLVKALKKEGITDPDEVLQKVRSFDALLERAGGDVNKLVRLLAAGGDEPAGKTGGDRMTKAEAKELADEFDLSDEEFAKLWETNNDAGKFFMKLSRSHSGTARQLKEALARLDRLEGGIKQKDSQAVADKWLGVIKAGASKIQDKDLADVYSDLMKAAYREQAAAGRVFNPDEVSTRILKKLKVNPTTSRIVQGAQQQRMANNNTLRPKHQAGGGGNASPARGKKESLHDVHKRLRAVG